MQPAISQSSLQQSATSPYHEADKIRSNSPVMQGADKSLARPGRKQATATEDFDFHTSCL
jgi:hypothetical protein